MKKLLLTLIALTIAANAEYEVFKSQTRSIGSVVKTEEVYFGEYNKFPQKVQEALEGGTTNALIAGLFMGGMGAGVYGVVGLMDPFVMSLHADQKHLSIVKLTDSKGKVAFKKVLFVGDKNPSYSDAQIRQLIK